MAIVIIEKGKKQKQNQKWQGTCRNCLGKAECLLSDISNLTYDQRENSKFSWEKCPECGAGPYGGLLMYPI